MIGRELQFAAEVLINDLLKTQKGEIVAITGDTASDMSVIEAVGRAAAMAGAKPLIVLIPTPSGVSLAADKDIQVEGLSGLLAHADIWIELNVKWLLYSTPFYRAKKANPSLRHMCLTGTTADTLIRCVGNVNYPAMRRFTVILRDKIAGAKQVRMVSQMGDVLSFENVQERPISCKLGDASVPGTHLFMGQIGWTPDIESVNGVICLDGSVAPDIGIITTPVKIRVEHGCIQSIDGGEEAKKYEAWLKGFAHPQMLRVSHAGIGFHPGAGVIGDILLDQRVWGSTTWGFGSIGAGMLPPEGVYAPSHSDAVSLNTDIYLDEKPLWLHGTLIDEELKELAGRLTCTQGKV
ncbi:aminopeptidase [[Clostridium] hylemonae]|uniref:aminopeptidase n=1 Tax=[Clostridium] hylemonae TaxID=89153 RepID=UPI0011063E54|nr:aminopeptidase [[Clostridium] hylemonae]